MTDLTARVHAIIASALGLAAVSDDQSLADLGADSLGILEMAMELETAFGVEIPDAAMDDLETVADVVALVRGVKG